MPIIIVPVDRMLYLPKSGLASLDRQKNSSVVEKWSSGVQKVGIHSIQDTRQSWFGSQTLTNQTGPKAQLGQTKVIWLDKLDLL